MFLIMGLITTTLFLMAALAESYERGFKIEELEASKIKAKTDYDDVITKLQDAQDENTKLSAQMFDVMAGTITNDSLLEFIKNNLNKFAHKWEHISTGNYNNMGRNKYNDSLISERCKCCGTIRRHWKDGDGAKYMLGYEGMFLGNKQITDEFKQVVCIGLLPLEFMNRKNIDVVRELNSNVEESSVLEEEIIAVTKRLK